MGEKNKKGKERTRKEKIVKCKENKNWGEAEKVKGEAKRKIYKEEII